jgi:hypothetical protein
MVGLDNQQFIQLVNKKKEICFCILINEYFVLVANGDQATADTLLNREMMIGCSCSESHRHAREHLRQASNSYDD